MPGNYTIINRVNGEEIDEVKYKQDHQQHIDNLEPPKVDDYSLSVAQMQTATDPGEVGSESQPTSLAGELERLRFAIRELKGTAQWYETLGFNLVTAWQPGDLKPTMRAVESPGWLLCNGQAVSRTTYAALFAAIGTTIGGPGDGSTTFNVPDIRGRSPIGVGQGPGLAINWGLGVKGGEESHVLSLAELASHTHAVIDPGHAHNAGKNVGILTPGAGGDLLAASGPVAAYDTLVNGTGIAIAANGFGAAHNNVGPSFGCNWLIKT